MNEAGGQIGWMWGGKKDSVWPLEAIEYNSSQFNPHLDLLLRQAREEKAKPYFGNLHFSIAGLRAGDSIVLTSDGVHDNISYTVHKNGIEHAYKVEGILENLFFPHKTSTEVAQALLNHVVSTTQILRQFEEETSRLVTKIKELEEEINTLKSDSDKSKALAEQLKQLVKEYHQRQNYKPEIGKPDHVTIIVYQTL